MLGLIEAKLQEAAVTLAEQLDYAQAANRLQITPDELSQRIVELENQLEVQIFSKEHDEIRLTPDGNTLVMAFRSFLAQIRRF